ncbi:hypothetical protein OF122_12890 [Pelagibacterium flavum]|uniref:Uncharacterized protein n=1 Tax=Pelagibacterium flavum TaxID=2984530 RepID=A0ABY6IK19_9HYPH|nr:hypothetical protein [Pelagibacterium sp. YIM 151497]UYQ70954.1 hypothetical protein OF122_12890 [Pelagibacterium sp. YIM 151497]
MWSFIISQFGPWLLGAGGILVGIVVAYFKGQGDGKKLERTKTAEQNAKAAKVRKDVDDDVVKMGNDDLDSQFNRWVRNGKR